MQLGNPSNASADTNNFDHYLIQRMVEALDFSNNLGEPVWASWDLTSSDVGSTTRSPNYFTDTNLPSNFYHVTDVDYNGVGAIDFNRGHMCPSEDRTDSRADNDMVFFMSNIIPQAATNNQTVWGNFEGDCRTLASSGNELLIICGPSGFTSYRIPSGKAAIANYTWKIAVVVPLGAGTALSRITAATRVISLKIPNSNNVSSVWQDYITTAEQIQTDTGFTFFTALPHNLAWVLRSKVDGQTAPAPVISGFSPTSGATNTSVVITGTNLDSTTNVTFNGTSASFNIDSPSQVTATVPMGATSGHIGVASLGGSIATSSNFTVNSSLLQGIQTVFIILMENHDWSQIKGSASAPFINGTLLPIASHAEQYYNPPSIHPSLPNYLWLEAGTNFGIANDSDPSVNHQNTTNHLVSLLNRAGVSWTSYQEDITGSTCPLTSVNRYAPKHNPMVYFDDVTNTNNSNSAYCVANVRPYTELSSDLLSNVVTRYNFITPNLCNDMHDSCSPLSNQILQGDTWLSNNLPAILNSQAYINNGAVFIVWDEAANADGPIGMIVLSPLARGGGYSNSVHYTHSSTLRTMEEIFNVGPLLGDAANATNLSDLFNFGSPAQLSVSPGSGLTSSGPAGGPFSPNTQNYNLTNSGGATLNWTATKTANWLTLSASAGTLAPGSNATVTVSLNANANSLAAGVYSDTVSFTNTSNGAGNTSRSVSLTVQAPPAVVTGAASGVGTNFATLNGTVNPNSSSTTAQFQYGLTTGYGSNATVAGTLSGTTTQGVSANITGLAPGTTYHFRVSATNSLGTNNGLDQTFTTPVSATPDLAITKTHAGNFTQGDTGDTYAIIITNMGSAASSGTVTVADTLPGSLTATAIGGTGWTPNLGTLTCTRSDTLAPGASYPPITVTVNVSSGAPASITNTAVVSGGGDANSANNTAIDATTINASGGGAGTATNVVISQVYGGGGNVGASYQNDFVELFNPLSTAVDLSTWSVQYASTAGTTWANKANLTGSIQPHHYYLIQLASNAAVGAALPTADAVNTTINMSATSGKVALVSNQTALIGSNPVSSNGVVDFVGYGTANAFEGTAAAPTISGNVNSIVRKNGGYTDTNDNSSDFVISAPANPRNSASPANLPPMADLAISMTHPGTFTQADIGDTYTIVITNVGTAVSAGTVTVSDTLPTGLSATAISGTGWTANLGTLTCTRSDAVGVGSGYPPITVTVNVATNAPSSVTNVATVSGGGQTNTLNDTASDPTSITALTPIQSWRLQWFGSTANSGPGADTAIATSDGMPNMLKYALGLNPLVAASNPVVGDITTGYLRLTLPKNPNATDISFHVEVSPDLVPASWTGSGTTIDQNTSTLLQVHVNVPVSSSDRNFIRLRVSRP